jgi:predicted dehydrogenase
MNNSKVRVAFIGAGKQANWRHYPPVSSMPDVELAALCDFHSDKADQTAQRWGVPKTYQDYKQMLEEVNPQAVFIITNPKDTFELASYALGQGRHVFIEKPPGLNVNQIKMLAYYAEVNKCLTMVGFQRRFVPAMTALKSRVEERGPIHSVSVANLKSTGDFSRPSGSGMLDQLTSDGMHAVDNLRWLAGGDVQWVTSHVDTLYIPGPVANNVMAQVEFSNGVVGQLHYSLVTGGASLQPGATAPGYFRAEIHGKNISASVDADRQSTIVADSGEHEVFDSKTFGESAGTEPEHWLGFWHQTRHFIDCIKESREPSSNFADAVKTWELINQIYESCQAPSRLDPT